MKSDLARVIEEAELPKGFRGAGLVCGIKPSGRKDLALFVSDELASVAVVATKNRFAAAPVEVTREHAKSGRARAFIVDSGNANAATGEQGLQDARDMCALTAEQIGCAVEQVLVNSTGVIGVPLPMEKVRKGIPEAARQLSVAGLNDAAEGILTTDKRPKRLTRRLGGSGARLFACAKGVGMIHPNMATLIGVILTDVAVGPELLQEALRQAVDRSFNCLTVDGDTSTNDMVVAFANGAAGPDEIKSSGDSGFGELVQVMTEACQELVHAIAADGEGASRVAIITVRGAETFEDARTLARTVGSSSLVKTALHGADPNWGRICMALGNAGVEFDPEQVSVTMQGIPLLVKGQPREFDKKSASESLKADDVNIEIEVGGGSGEATCWASSLTEEYVRFNSAYTT